MKTYIDKLREAPIEILERLISEQEFKIKIRQRDLEIGQRDLETMNMILKERTIKE